MKLVNSKNLFKDKAVGITIGSFDGLHLGHDYLINNFIHHCKVLDIEPVVITFTPHPLVYLKGVSDFLIQNISTKKHIFEKKYGISYLEIEFDEKLQKLDGENFFKELRLEFPDIKLFFTGHDFGLGFNKSINYKKAKMLLPDVEVIQDVAFEKNDERISSSLIRDHLRKGNIKVINQYMNRPFSLIGKVVEGNKIGREIGFPTANVALDKVYIKPKDGVYICEVILGEDKFIGVANIGKRPTVTSDSSSTIEVHILDFDRNIYERDIEILFYNHLRDERKFTSKEELVEQINEDIKIVRTEGLYKPFALIGKNISHSNSENVYKELLETKYLSYTLLDYSSEDSIENIKTNLEKYSYISITSPYKKFFFKNVDTVEPLVKDLGSVNCIKLLNDEVIGTNTDFFAIKEIISSLVKDNVSNILILGDGTMSGLVQYILSTFKIDFKVLSRKNNQLENLSENIVENSLIINTCARSYSPKFKTTSSCTFWDFNYNQEYAEELNTNKFINYYDGLLMLTLQAKYALSFWNLKTF